jgi:crossover junction endodeoxyribonuclease RuvC
MRILGIDPGYDRCGVAIVEKLPRASEQLLFSACITTSPQTPFIERLNHVGSELAGVITQFTPERASFETLFFSTNRKTAMRVAEARGMLLYVCISHGLDVYEYSPQAVKIALTGHGASEKSAVARMVDRLMRPPHPIGHDDEYDAIAIALTCMASERALS